MSETTSHARRWRAETVLAVLAAALGVLTVVMPAWIEVLTGLDPDAGSGTLEVLIAVGLFSLAASAAWAARRHRQGTATGVGVRSTR
jgi:23S rRNA G2445 N2-methylase RlmL